MRTYCFPSIFKCIICNVAMRKIITLRNIITYIITIYLCYYILRRDQRYKHHQHLQHLLRHFPGVLAVKKKADQTKRLRTTNITEFVPDASSMGSLPKKTHTVHCLPTRLGSTGSKDKRNNCNYEHSCTCIFTLQSDDYELHANKLC